MSASECVLIAEDEPQFAAVLEKVIRGMGLHPLVAADLKSAKDLLRHFPVRLAILDRKLKDGRDSLGICLELKKDPKTRAVPVIILTGLAEFEEELNSYRAGADLFLHKPVRIAELQRYVRAFMTRMPYKEEMQSKLHFGSIALDLAERAVFVGPKTHRDLPAKQFDLIYLLVSRQGKAVSRESLVRKLWNNEVRDKEVDVLVSRLRDNLGDDSFIIEPVRGLGYRIVDMPVSSKSSGA
jgi:two-component system phosphate regulon response regulator PhoB